MDIFHKIRQPANDARLPLFPNSESTVSNMRRGLESLNQIGSNYYMMKLYQQLSPDIKGHSLRVSLIMGLIAEYMLKSQYPIPQRFGAESNSDIISFAREAGSYHDIGKIEVPAQLLKKHGELKSSELSEIRNHTIYAEKLMLPCIRELSLAEQPYFRAVLEVCVSHHERWDGKGYPYGKSGEAIPFFARVCSVADSFDAMVSKRYYSVPKTPAAAAEEIRRCSGSQFDPQAAAAFEAVLPQVMRLLKEKGRDTK
jgi:putative two-component system response regulator